MKQTFASLRGDGDRDFERSWDDRGGDRWDADRWIVAVTLRLRRSQPVSDPYRGERWVEEQTSAGRREPVRDRNGGNGSVRRNPLHGAADRLGKKNNRLAAIAVNHRLSQLAGVAGMTAGMMTMMSGSRVAMTRSAPPMQNFRDYYALLGIPQTANQADIKAAFRRLARQCHPISIRRSPS
ncbi:J domain-containing protein [Synechococcus elongatus]|uniref:J domain-containing protein n=1 Tax=Synechococcus elongatus TaxID=32046 RepID=UPI0030D52F48